MRTYIRQRLTSSTITATNIISVAHLTIVTSIVTYIFFTLTQEQQRQTHQPGVHMQILSS